MTGTVGISLKQFVEIYLNTGRERWNGMHRIEKNLMHAIIVGTKILLSILQNTYEYITYVPTKQGHASYLSFLFFKLLDR